MPLVAGLYGQPRRQRWLLEAVYDFNGAGVGRRNAPKNAIGTESIRIFWGISTQDYPSLADFEYVLKDGRDTPS